MRVILAQASSAYLQSSFEALLGFLQVIQVFQDTAEVVDVSGNSGMIRSVDLLVDLKRSLEALLCFLRVTQVFQDIAEVVDHCGHGGMVWSVDLLAYL